MAKRFYGDKEVKQTKKIANGRIRVKIQDPTTRTTKWIELTEAAYRRSVRHE